MNYLFWDTERIRNTKIYMQAYVLTDESFNIINKDIIIDSSIDVSHRHSPKSKVERLKSESIVFDNFSDVANFMLPLLSNNKVVCFGKDDYVAFNDQLKINGFHPITGTYYDLEVFIKEENRYPTNLGDAAVLLGVKHDAHNPLSDSMVTMEYFKFLLNQTSEESMIRKIPNKDKVLDIIANGSYELKGKNK